MTGSGNVPANPIVCEEVRHVYPSGVVALEGVSFEAGAAEVVGIVGQNGSGKTTLVRHFNGLLKPTRGRVLVNRLDSRRETVQSLSRQVGYVFQNPNHQLFAGTVEAELAFGPKNLGLERQQIEERVRQSSEFFDLAHLLTTHPYRLSLAQRKLVAMASVYAMQPTVLVLDEPTTGQDHAGAVMVRKLITRLREQGKTVVVVSHDMALIAEVTDRIAVMCSAEILATGTPRDVFADDEVMKRAQLRPPQITQLSQRRTLQGARRHLALSVGEAVDSLLDDHGLES